MKLGRAPEGAGGAQGGNGGNTRAGPVMWGCRIPIPARYGGVGPDLGPTWSRQTHATQPRRAFRRVPSMIDGPPARMAEGHRYVTPEGLTYASVTTVLGGTKPEGDVLQLEKWRESVGLEVAAHITREAAAIGTQAHQLNEYYLNGMVPDESDEPFRMMSRAHHEKFLPHLDRIDNIRGTEMVLHSDTLRLAGTSDCIAEYDGVLSIIDYKTKRAPQKAEWMHDYYLQAAAYALMYRELSGVGVRQAVIMASSEMDTMQVFTASTTDFMEEFLERLNLWQGLPRHAGAAGAAPLFDDVQEAAGLDLFLGGGGGI